MERRIAEINRFTDEWTAYYWCADTPLPFEKLDKWLRRRLRQVRWKEWNAFAPSDASSPRSHPDRQRPQMGVLPQGVLAHLELPSPSLCSTERLLDQPRPEMVPRTLPPPPGCQANRRMRTRTSGGVRGTGVSPAPTR